MKKEYPSLNYKSLKKYPLLNNEKPKSSPENYPMISSCKEAHPYAVAEIKCKLKTYPEKPSSWKEPPKQEIYQSGQQESAVEKIKP